MEKKTHYHFSCTANKILEIFIFSHSFQRSWHRVPYQFIYWIYIQVIGTIVLCCWWQQPDACTYQYMRQMPATGKTNCDFFFFFNMVDGIERQTKIILKSIDSKKLSHTYSWQTRCDLTAPHYTYYTQRWHIILCIQFFHILFFSLQNWQNFSSDTDYSHTSCNGDWVPLRTEWTMNGWCAPHSKWECEMKPIGNRPPRLDRFTACLACEHTGCDTKLEFTTYRAIFQ